MANGARTLIAFSSLCLFGCTAPERAPMAVPGTSVQSESVPAPVTAPAAPAAATEMPTYTQSGIASWYREKGRFKRTANGEKPEPTRLTAAHRSLPFGTIARVTSLRTGRSILVRINDRGPFVRRRIIDLSYGAAATLGILDGGVEKVSIAVYATDQCGVASTSILCLQAAAARAAKLKAPKHAVKKRSAQASLSARSGRTIDNTTARD